jgi:hypothetical protein
MFWLSPHLPQTGWLAAGCGLTLACAALAFGTGSRGILTAAQAPLALSVASFANWAMLNAHPLLALIPIATLGVQAALAATVAPRRFGREWLPWRAVAQVSGAAACALIIAWAFAYIPGEWLPLFFASAAAAMFVPGRRNDSFAKAALALAATGLVLIWTQAGTTFEWQDAAAVLVVASAWHVSERGATSPLFVEFRHMPPSVFVATAWLLVTRFNVHVVHARSFTVAWSLFALVVFGSGLALRERAYRLAGIITLGLSVAHVFLVDVWKLGEFYRIASFLVLGVALLILGFCYNRFRDFIRRWM